MDILIVILLAVLILKDYVPKRKVDKPNADIKQEIKTEENEKAKELQEEFDAIMGYTIENAIQSKRGE